MILWFWNTFYCSLRIKSHNNGHPQRYEVPWLPQISSVGLALLPSMTHIEGTPLQNRLTYVALIPIKYLHGRRTATQLRPVSRIRDKIPVPKRIHNLSRILMFISIFIFIGYERYILYSTQIFLRIPTIYTMPFVNISYFNIAAFILQFATVCSSCSPRLPNILYYYSAKRFL